MTGISTSVSAKLCRTWKFRALRLWLADRLEGLFFGGMRGELWIQPGKPASQASFSSTLHSINCTFPAYCWVCPRRQLDLVSPGIPVLGLPEPARSQTYSSQVLPHIVCPALERPASATLLIKPAKQHSPLAMHDLAGSLPTCSCQQVATHNLHDEHTQ